MKSWLLKWMTSSVMSFEYILWWPLSLWKHILAWVTLICSLLVIWINRNIFSCVGSICTDNVFTDGPLCAMSTQIAAKILIGKRSPRSKKLHCNSLKISTTPRFVLKKYYVVISNQHTICENVWVMLLTDTASSTPLSTLKTVSSRHLLGRRRSWRTLSRSSMTNRVLNFMHLIVVRSLDHARSI